MGKKLAMILLCLIMVSSITGCGGKSNEITITMLCSGTKTENDFETEVFPKLVKEHFPEITVEVMKLPDNQYETTLKSKLASGSCADIIVVQPLYASSTSVLNLAEAGYLQALDGMEAIEKAGVGADSFTYEGSVYGIPSGVCILGTYYNKDLFDQYNLEVPTTWDDFLAVCKTLKDNNIQPIVMGDKDKYEMQYGLYQLACNEIYAEDSKFDISLRSKTTKFTDKDRWDQVFSMYGQLYKEGYMGGDSLALSDTQAIQQFVDGEAAMTFGGSFDIQNMTAQGKVDFQRGYFPLPGTAKEVYAAMSAGPGPAIYSGSENVAACKKILELMYDGESDLYQAYVDTRRFIPTYGYGVDEIDSMYAPFIEKYAQEKAFYWCNQAWPSGLAEEMEELFTDYISGKIKDVDKLTEGMQKKYEELQGE